MIAGGKLSLSHTVAGQPAVRVRLFLLRLYGSRLSSLSRERLCVPVIYNSRSFSGIPASSHQLGLLLIWFCSFSQSDCVGDGSSVYAVTV